jgi:hypothetical protein
MSGLLVFADGLLYYKAAVETGREGQLASVDMPAVLSSKSY